MIPTHICSMCIKMWYWWNCRPSLFKLSCHKKRTRILLQIIYGNNLSDLQVQNKMNCELMLTYDTPALRQTGSRNLTGQKTLPTIWGTYMKLVTKYQISAINSCRKNSTKNGHIQNVCSIGIKINKVGKQEVGIWWVQKRFPRYGIPIWSLWPDFCHQ